MSAAARPDRWADLVRAAQAYAQEKWGIPAVAIGLELLGGQWTREPLPPHLAIAPTPDTSGATPEGSARPDDWASGPEPKHTADYRRVYWPGTGEFRLSDMQALVVSELWDAYEVGTWEVGQDELLKVAGSRCTRLRDLFARSDVWGTLVVPGVQAGSYRLPPLLKTDQT